MLASISGALQLARVQHAANAVSMPHPMRGVQECSGVPLLSGSYP